MKKVLFIVESFGGGVFTYLVNLSNELSKHYEIYIIYNIRPQTPDDYKTYFNKSIHLIRVKNLQRSIRPINDVISILKIKKIIKKISPDIIHLHSSKAGALGRIIVSDKNIPLFYTPHGYSFLMSNTSLIKKTMYRLIEYILARGSSITIACSEGEYRESLKLNKKAKFVNNGINVDGLKTLVAKKEKQFSHKHEEIVIFTIGRISYQKNPDLFNKIALSFPNNKFIWIGDGELRSHLTSKNIHISGWVNKDEALRLANKCDLFLLTSLWEGLPMSLLESMCLKKLCIISNIDGNNNVIKDDINGILCNNFSEFYKAISKVINTDIDYTSKINRAYYDVVHKYNSKIAAHNYEIIYKEYLNKVK
jgi:glycosyltransferase involved in cell wall biosynthesis